MALAHAQEVATTWPSSRMQCSIADRVLSGSLATSSTASLPRSSSCPRSRGKHLPACCLSQRTEPTAQQRSSAFIQVGKGRMQEMERILLCSERTLVKMSRKYPRLLMMRPNELLERLLSLKSLLPRCNVAQMVVVQPLLFLGQPAAEVDRQVSSNYALLQRQLPGVNVDELVQERPAMLFIDPGCVPLGLQQLQEVIKTPHDTSTVSNLLWAFYGPSLEDRNGCILI